MNLEPRNKLKRENLDDVEDGKIKDSKKRCSLLEISTSENTVSTLRALKIPEVLTRIMKHLPAGDFINFRCVCKLWNEYSEPKFVFRDFVCQDDEVAALLLNSGCRRLKLEFQSYTVEFIPVDMWEKCGRKIRSLHFHCCDIEMNTLQSIISHCVALEKLEICRKYHLFNFSKLSVVQLLDCFLERKERRTRLRVLAVEDYKPIKITEFLKKTFTVFPCIVDLRCTFDGVYEDVKETCSASDRTYDLRKLTSYTVVSKNDYLWSKNSVVPMLDYQLLRLKKFKTILHLEDFFTDLTKKERLFQFFTVQKDLAVIDIKITTTYKGIDVSTRDLKVFIKSLVFHVLKSCSHLREFQLIGGCSSIKLTGEESKEFFSLISNLQSLKLSYFFKKDTSEITVLPSSLPNLSLSVLKLNLREPYFLSVVKQSTQLKHLYINLDSDEHLREIIIALPNLETLVLKLYVGVTNYGFTGENEGRRRRNEEFSIRRLQNLEYLYIIDHSAGISNEIFDEFCFPRLKYLGLSFDEKKLLPKTLSNMPALKTLAVFFRKQFRWPTKVVTELCKSLTNLNHLIVEELVDQNTTLVVEYFNSLSNLNLITCCRDGITYIFNRISGEARCSVTRELEFFENKFFGKITD